MKENPSRRWCLGEFRVSGLGLKLDVVLGKGQGERGAAEIIKTSACKRVNL